MTRLPETEDWQKLAALIRQPDAGLTRTFPSPSRQLSLLEALADSQVAATPAMTESGKKLAVQLSGLLTQLQLQTSISRCPILAIAGQLNAGKSSLLATYLSPDNRPRVLRGLSNQSGTHRFVLWLPNVWREDPSLLDTLLGFISSLFGNAPELLADDPDLAAQQMNGRILPTALMATPDSQSPADPSAIAPSSAAALSTAQAFAAQAAAARGAIAPPFEPTGEATGIDPLSVPLIAYDATLDNLRIGLLDCPDIQTGLAFPPIRSSSPAVMAATRRQHLLRIGRLCSAFVVVCKLNSLHDEGLLQILTTLRDAMPGVPRLLAVNRIKARYAPATVYDEARGLVDRFGLEAIYGAYDFRSSLAHSRVPQPPAGMHGGEEQQPIFFEFSPLPSPPGSSAPPRFLFNLGDRLDAGALAQASSGSLLLQFKTQLALALEWLEANQQQRAAQIRFAWQAIADACYEFMAERDSQGRATGLRLQASPAIIAQMADSLQVTAPVWMRVSLGIDRTARQLQQAISNSASRFKILQSASQSVAQFTQKFRRGEGAQVVTPERLASTLRSFDRRDTLHALSVEALTAACESAMQRFAAENKTLLDEAELMKWSAQVWKDMSWRDKLWKGTQPLAVLMAPLLAVVLVPFDGGGSAVLVFASVKELLAAAGLAAILGPATTGGEALSIVHRETPWRQLSDLFAISCDSLGLPRPAPTELPRVRCGGNERQLLKSQVEIKTSSVSPAVCQWQLPSGQLVELRNRLN